MEKLTRLEKIFVIEVGFQTRFRSYKRERGREFQTRRPRKKPLANVLLDAWHKEKVRTNRWKGLNCQVSVALTGMVAQYGNLIINVSSN